MAEDENGNYAPLDLENLRLATHKFAIDMPGSYLDYFTRVIEAIQMLEAERRTRLDLCADIARLQKERDAWKKRAGQHGCNTDDGDPECG
jgi:hypothetical protein